MITRSRKERAVALVVHRRPLMLFGLLLLMARRACSSPWPRARRSPERIGLDPFYFVRRQLAICSCRHRASCSQPRSLTPQARCAARVSSSSSSRIALMVAGLLFGPEIKGASAGSIRPVLHPAVRVREARLRRVVAPGCSPSSSVSRHARHRCLRSLCCGIFVTSCSCSSPISAKRRSSPGLSRCSSSPASPGS